MLLFESKKIIIKALLSRVYSKDEVVYLLKEIKFLCSKYQQKFTKLEEDRDRGFNQVQWSEKSTLLITYGDSLLGKEKPLQVLQQFLEEFVKENIEFVHILPFFPYTSDDGFSVVDFRKIDTSLGSWEDVQSLGENYKMVFDVVINHVSASSIYMQEQCKGNPLYENFCLTVNPKDDWSQVVRPRNLPLLSKYKTDQGSQYFWTTFSRDQIDLNYQNPKVLLEIMDILLFYYSQGSKMIRLDAIAFLWKKKNSTCIHLDQTHNIVKLFRQIFKIVCPEMMILTETNVPHKENISYFGGEEEEAHIVYNFSLPPLILYSLFKGNSQILTQWAKTLIIEKENTTFLNMTATHDGIGVRPAEAILNTSQIKEMAEHVQECGGEISYKKNIDGSASPYELNITYFDALGGGRNFISEETHIVKFLTSQMIVLAFKGIPAIYIHSLLGSRNDFEGLKNTGKNRSINRQKISIEDVKKQLKTENSLRARVFSSYKKYLNLRKKQKAFSPESPQEVLQCGENLFVLLRGSTSWGQTIYAIHNVSNEVQFCIIPSVDGGLDLLSFTNIKSPFKLNPYQVLWIE